MKDSIIRRFGVFAFAVLLIGATTVSGKSGDPARDWVKQAAEAMGGENALSGIHGVAFKAMGHLNALEQSERPEGPWVVTYEQITQYRDFEHNARRVETSSRGYVSPNWWDDAGWTDASVVVVAESVSEFVQGGKKVAAGRDAQREADESLALDPLRVLLNALGSSDLHAEPDVMLHGFTHHVAAFTWNGYPVTIFISSYTHLPTAVEITRPRQSSVFLGPWGDVTTRTTFGSWTLEPGGIHYPRQWTMETNHQPDFLLVITQVRFNPEFSPDTFTIDSSVKQDFAKRVPSLDDLPLATSGPSVHEPAPGVVQLTGAWNITEVRQEDGVVIIEGPISSGYSAKVIEDAQKRFPNLPVKAVITTSDSWPHIGGLREYAARGIPIYALDLNRPILERLMAAPHRLRTDSLALHPQPAKFHFVSGKFVLGSGANRLELIPYREATGERQMMVYFPDKKLLYSSDLFAPNPDGTWFIPQYLSEAADAVKRENITVETVFGMHYDPTPWQKVLDVIQSAIATKPNPNAITNPS